MTTDDFLDRQDKLSKIALDVVRELKEELSGDWHLEAVGKKRRVVPKKEFYGKDEPKYETGIYDYER